MFTDIADSLASAGIAKGIAIGVALSSRAVVLALALLTYWLSMRGIKLATSPNDSFAEFVSDVMEKIALMAVVLFLIDPTIGTYPTLIRNWIWEPMMGLVGAAQGGEGFAQNANGLRVIEGALDGFQIGLVDVLFDPRGTSTLNLGAGIPISGIFVQAMPMLVVGVVSIVVAISKAVIIASYCSGIVLFAVGAAVGPFFVAFLVNDRLDNYFWSWLRFMLVAAATLLVAVIIIAVLQTAMPAYIAPDSGQVNTAFQQMLQGAAQGLTGPADYLKVGGVCILISLFLGYMLSQSSEIANALFSGNPSGVKSGIRPLANLGRSIAGGASNIAKRATSSASSGRSGSRGSASGGGNGTSGGGGPGGGGTPPGAAPAGGSANRFQSKLASNLASGGLTAFGNKAGAGTAKAVGGAAAAAAAISAAVPGATAAAKNLASGATPSVPKIGGPPVVSNYPFGNANGAGGDSGAAFTNRAGGDDNEEFSQDSSRETPKVSAESVMARSESRQRLRGQAAEALAKVRATDLPGGAKADAAARIIRNFDPQAESARLGKTGGASFRPRRGQPTVSPDKPPSDDKGQ